MIHIFKYVLTDYIDNEDKKTLLEGKSVDDFILPFNLLGISVNWKNDYALGYACKNDHLEIVKFLTDKGADIHHCDDYCVSPVEIACTNGHLDIVEFLMSKRVSIHEFDDYTLRIASEKGYLNIVKLLVKNGGDIHALDDAPIRIACENGHLDVAEYLLEKGAHIHAMDNYCLKQASYYGHLDVVKFLIGKFCDTPPTYVDLYNRVIYFAKENKHVEVIKFLKSKLR
jgi:ankyrin repeat protein